MTGKQYPANADNRLEALIAGVLRTGVIISGSLVVAGAILFLVRHGAEHPAYQIFKPDVINFLDFRNLIEGVLAFRSVSIMELGILLLIATPVLRVLLSLFIFAWQKDLLYVLITAIVLVVLLVSFLG